MNDKLKVALICRHKSCRSQMAEAISQIPAADVFEAFPDGTGIKTHI